MRWIDKLERRFGRHFGIPNLMVYVTATMLALFVMNMVLPINITQWFSFNRAAVAQGQIWRIITFALLPPNSSMLFIIFALYLYYMFGTQLENAWSTFRFTLYYVVGIVGHLIAGMISGSIITNVYLNLSILLAYATLFPNTQLMLFFILPIKIKWMAYFYGLTIGVQFLYALFVGDIKTWSVILFSLLNYIVFFGPDLFYGAKNRIATRKRRRKFKQQMNGNDSIWR